MVITGQSLNFMNLSSSTGLKWTVSETEPSNPKTGDLWVLASPDEVSISQVILMQTDEVSVTDAEPNTIYLLIPYDGTTMPADAFEINYIENDKCTLTAICTTMIVTDSTGTSLEIDRAIYTGTEWHWWTGFPSEPSSYNLIDTYTSSQTWTAPESGWFQIEVFGASGNGGATGCYIGDYYFTSSSVKYYGYVRVGKGGGGGGGAYACSIVKLNQGDTIALTRGAAGSTTKAVISSSADDSSSHTITCTSGGHGGAGTATSSASSGASAGFAGSAGTASGGNVSNIRGTAGNAGTVVTASLSTTNYDSSLRSYISGGSGANSGRDGGNSGYMSVSTAKGTINIQTDDEGNYDTYSNIYGYNVTANNAAGSGSAGFFKIYRGNTNVTA